LFNQKFGVSFRGRVDHKKGQLKKEPEELARRVKGLILVPNLLSFVELEV
jgi:hypothetical protein